MDLLKFVREVKEENEYQLEDGIKRIRLAGMRKIIQLLTGTVPNPKFEFYQDKSTEEFKCLSVVGKYHDFEEKVMILEYFVEGDPYWEKMPIKAAQNTCEARLYRRAYPLLFGDQYISTEGAVARKNNNTETENSKTESPKAGNPSNVWGFMK